MKKLMIAAAIVCAAAMSQAASINWQATNYNFVDAEGTVHTAATAPAGQFVLVYLGNTTSGYSWDNASVVNTGTVTYDTVKGAAVAKASGTYEWTADTEGVGVVANGDIFGVMFKDGDNLVKLSTVGGEAIDPIFTVSGLGNNTYSGDHYFASSNYTVAQSVPEPTSAMLLLLGVAGLALRRRRA